jgi:hypothetical protein
VSWSKGSYWWPCLAGNKKKVPWDASRATGISTLSLWMQRTILNFHLEIRISATVCMWTKKNLQPKLFKTYSNPNWILDPLNLISLRRTSHWWFRTLRKWNFKRCKCTSKTKYLVGAQGKSLISKPTSRLWSKCWPSDMKRTRHGRRSCDKCLKASKERTNNET